jgi:hypothetical protein
MAENTGRDEDDVLVCEFSKRPRGAPTVFDVLPSVRGVERHVGSLDISFDPGAAATVKEYVAAERLCCSTLRWDLQLAPELRLSVAGTPGRLDQLALLYSQPVE